MGGVAGAAAAGRWLSVGGASVARGLRLGGGGRRDGVRVGTRCRGRRCGRVPLPAIGECGAGGGPRRHGRACGAWWSRSPRSARPAFAMAELLSARGIGVVDAPVSEQDRRARWPERCPSCMQALPTTWWRSTAPWRWPASASTSACSLGWRCVQAREQRDLGRGHGGLVRRGGAGRAGPADAGTLVSAINAGLGRNAATEPFPTSILPGTFDYGGPLGSMLKDLALFIDEAPRARPDGRHGASGACCWSQAVECGRP